MKEDTTSNKQLIASRHPILKRLSPVLGNRPPRPFRSLQTTQPEKRQAKMPTSRPKDTQKIENFRSILHSQYNDNNSNKSRPLPFCVHGDLFARHPGASYYCRNDHHSRTPTPTSTPHLQRSRASLRQTGGVAPPNSLKDKNNAALADVRFGHRTYEGDQEEEGEKGRIDSFAPEAVQ